MSEESVKIERIADEIINLNLMQVPNLIILLKKKLGIDEKVIMSTDFTGKENGVKNKEEKREEKKVVSYSIIKKEIKKPTKAYIAVKRIYSNRWGKEINIFKAKEIIEKDDNVIFDNISIDDANYIKEEFEKIEAEIEVKEK